MKAEEKKRVILWDEDPDITELSEFKGLNLVGESSKIVDEKRGPVGSM